MSTEPSPPTPQTPPEQKGGKARNVQKGKAGQEGQKPPREPLPVNLRPATAEDLPAIVAMLADDHLGAQRESPDDPEVYRSAFDRLSADPNQHLVVAEHEGSAVGTLQLTLIPGLSRRGATRATIEAVRVHSKFRESGLGTQLLEWAIAEARRQDCALVQLTSDATRVGAHRFYEHLGFEASHLGFKMLL